MKFSFTKSYGSIVIKNIYFLTLKDQLFIDNFLTTKYIISLNHFFEKFNLLDMPLEKEFIFF